MKKLIFLILGIIILNIMAQSATVNLPVPALLLYKINLSLTRLQKLLNKYNPESSNKTQVWTRLELTKRYMGQVNMQMAKYSSVTTGTNNSVNGTKNVIIGNYNKLQGGHNWVLVSNFTGRANGSLLISKYVILLNMTQYFFTEPKMVMSSINDQKNKELLAKINSTNRSFVKFGQWVDPQSDIGKFWSNYIGFNEWSTDWEKKLISWITDALMKSTNKQQTNNLRQQSFQTIQPFKPQQAYQQNNWILPVIPNYYGNYINTPYQNSPWVIYSNPFGVQGNRL